MSVKQVLAILRKERAAIGEAISALEKISAPQTKPRGGPRPSRKPATLRQLVEKDHGPADTHHMKIIEFRRPIACPKHKTG